MWLRRRTSFADAIFKGESMKDYNTTLLCEDRAEFPDRENYVKSIEAFIEESFQNKAEERTAYTLNTDQETRREAFRAMHGFPLTEYELKD